MAETLWARRPYAASFGSKGARLCSVTHDPARLPYFATLALVQLPPLTSIYCLLVQKSFPSHCPHALLPSQVPRRLRVPGPTWSPGQLRVVLAFRLVICCAKFQFGVLSSARTLRALLLPSNKTYLPRARPGTLRIKHASLQY